MNSTSIRTIENYWTRRAPSYSEVVHKNMSHGWDSVWAQELIRNFPEVSGRALRVLDIGTGPGFFAIILAKRGYDVTAVDLSPGMIHEAKVNAGALASSIDFRQMNAQELDFCSDQFDVIVTRNLTWNLPDPARAYSEWHRVLRKDGVMLNIDSNWYSYLRDPRKADERRATRIAVQKAGCDDHESYEEGWIMEDIADQLSITDCARPGWDLHVLSDIGFSRVTVDKEISSRVLNDEEKINYASTPYFLIKATK